MSLSGYDLRSRGGPRRALRFRPRWRYPTPGEIRLAGWSAFALFGLWVCFVVDQPAVTHALSRALDAPPKVERCDSSVRLVERPREGCAPSY